MFWRRFSDYLKIQGGLHSFYGVNCYQYAVGFKPPLFHNYNKPDQPDDNVLLFYVSLMPGTLCFQDDWRDVRNIKRTNNRILSACEEDGMNITKKRGKIPDGYRKLAVCLYEKHTPDFHFLRYEADGSWSYKLPCNVPTTVVSPEAYAKETGLTQKPVYLLAPEKMTPTSVKCALKARRLKRWFAPSWPIKSMKMYEVLPPVDHPISFGTGPTVNMFDTKTGVNRAAIADNPRVMFSWPAPPWPLQEKPVQASSSYALGRIASLIRRHKLFRSLDIE